MKLSVFYLKFSARPGGNTGTSELEAIQDRYMTCLRAYTQHICPQQPTRFHELLVRLPEVKHTFYHFSYLLFGPTEKQLITCSRLGI